MKRIFTFLDLKFSITQYRWGRKMFGGKWYFIYPRGLSMGFFWSDEEITSCQSETVKTEIWL